MIIFKKVSLKNFMSYGNTVTEVNLNKNDITVFVGQNGNGKSVVIEAIVFALFGKPFRNINKPQLVNATNQKDCVVEIEFDTNGISYRVVRGLKPTLFEIYADGVMVDQSSKIKDYQQFLEDTILKINYKTFTQVVVLGTATYTPFMELTAANRREVVEELLGIQIFSAMNDLVKAKINSLKEQYIITTNDEVVCREKIALMERHAEDVKANSTTNITFIEKEIGNQKSVLSMKIMERGQIQTEIFPIYDLEKGQKKVAAKAEQFNKYNITLSNKLTIIDKELSFFLDNDHCPTCTQSITEQLKTAKQTERLAERKTLEAGISKLHTDMENTQKEYSEYQQKILRLKNKQIELIAVEGAIQGINNTIASFNKQLSTAKVSDSTRTDLKGGEMETEKEKLAAVITQKQKVLKAQAEYGVMSTLLKDNGIKATIIKQYIPIMNTLINKYLNDMDFFIDFNLTENFSEEIKSRNRHDYSYSSFSEGEKFKINLALLFTWREIAKMRNSAATNLLFLDEILDSSLDVWGTDAVLKLIHTLKNTNTFIISHKVDILQDKFTNIFTITKDKGFSKIKK